MNKIILLYHIDNLSTIICWFFSYFCYTKNNLYILKMPYHLFTDGSYSPNLNISSIGGYLLDENKNVIFEFSEKLEKSFLKYHELAALQHGLQECLSHNILNVVCYADDISLRNLNYLEVVSNKHPIDFVKKTLIEDIIELRKKFELIEFKHIMRNFNKKADKLAERVQLEYFYDNIFFKERYEIDSKKFLPIPNLICIEDYYSKNSSTEHIEDSKNIINIKFSNSDLYYILKLESINENEGTANLFSIDKNTLIETFIEVRNFDIKKVNSHCLDLLDIGFKNIKQSPKPSLGLIITSENLALKKFDMLMRRRFIFPKIKTPLVDRFLNSCSNFSEILLIDEKPDFLIPKSKFKNKIIFNK